MLSGALRLEPGLLSTSKHQRSPCENEPPMKFDSPWAIPQCVAGTLTANVVFDLVLHEAFTLGQAIVCVALGVVIVLLNRRLRASRR